MKKTKTMKIMAILIPALLVTLVCGGVTANAEDTPEYVENEILVKFKPDVTDKKIKSINSTHKTTIKKRMSGINVHVIEIPGGATVLDMVEEYKKLPEVEYAEPNYIAHALLTPNDPFYPDQWNLPKIGADFAWDITVGNPAITIAIIDTGVEYTHEDLAGKVIAGYDFVWDDADPADTYGHGTGCAAIAAAQTDNLLGVAGVSWLSEIMPVKVLTAWGSGSYDDVASGIIYAADYGAEIISLSLGGLYNSLTLEDAVDYAFGKGCLLVAAAGNDYNGPVLYPAAYTNCMAVSATDITDVVADFSNIGPEIDVAAPGVNITSAWLGNTYSTGSGTSYACPHVSGLAALLLGMNPSLTNLELWDLICSTADDLGSPGFDIFYGYGRINAYVAAGTIGSSIVGWVRPSYVKLGDTLNIYAFTQEIPANISSVVATMPNSDTVSLLYNASTGRWEGEYIISLDTLEGTYTATITVTYTSGLSSTVQTDSYMVDFTPPTITSFAPQDGSAVTEGGYEAITVTVTDNFGANFLATEIKVNDDRIDCTYDPVNGIVVGQNTLGLKPENGLQTVTIVAKDLAGNTTSTNWSFTFAVPPYIFYNNTEPYPPGTITGNNTLVSVPVYPYIRQYAHTYQPSSGLSVGGAALGLKGDDVEILYSLPFAFPFYGFDHTEVYINSNGIISLKPLVNDPYFTYENKRGTFLYNPSIAPLYYDLRTDVNLDDDVYVSQPTPDSICFRWKAMTADARYALEFECILYSNGDIKFNYGDMVEVPDYTPPVISSVLTSNITDSTATITWTTDESSDSEVNYGTITVSSPTMVTSHSISLTGLGPGTTYYYEVCSTDFAGNTALDNNIGDYYTFTTLDTTPANLMHVANIDMSTYTWRSKGTDWVNATTVVTIVDANGLPVEGATVSGHWSGVTTDIDSGITDINGQVSLTSDDVATTSGTFTFTVDDVVKTDCAYDPASNVETSDAIAVGAALSLVAGDLPYTNNLPVVGLCFGAPFVTYYPYTAHTYVFNFDHAGSVHWNWRGMLIDETTLSMTIDGAPVLCTVEPQTLTYAISLGNYIYGETGWYDIVYADSPLSDGEHTVAVEVGDITGSYNSYSWSFTVDTIPPTISDLTPPDGSDVTTATPTISAIVLDNTQVGIVSMWVDDIYVGGTGYYDIYDEITGLLSYTPTTPLAAGLHTVRVKALDYIVSNIADVTWSFTVDAGVPANALHVASITLSTSTWKKSGTYWANVTAVVTIVDAEGLPVEGATVSGYWSGLTTDTESGVTDINGQVSLTSDDVAATSGTFSFTVDNVVKTDWTYDPASNVEISDSISL